MSSQDCITKAELQSEPQNDPVSVCRVCGQQKAIIDPWSFGRISIKFLQDGADCGCRTCRIRYVAARNYCSDLEQVVTFQDKMRTRLFFKRGEYFEIFRLPGSNSDNKLFEKIQLGYPLSSNTSSEQTFERIRGWIETCAKSHSACKIRQLSPPYMPKRVLDLSANRIVLREGARPGPYVSLSHCWGPNQSPIKTVSSTIDDFKRDIPWQRLSRTFQDAIDVCRRLDVHYIWIDSLCIIQDSIDDWNVESVKMADVYENAFLTIAATKSKDGSGGCYIERDPQHVECKAIIEGSVYIRKEMPYFNDRTGHSSDLCPLLDRGWVHQEMALSARVLHFCLQEIVWQCRSCRRSESGRKDDDDDEDGDGQKTVVPYKSTQVGIMSWYERVEVYARLDLTFKKDRLAALAAVAQREAETRRGDEYVAGLWRSTLLSDLCWHLVQSSTPAGRPVGCRFPSWSWASVSSPVEWYGRFRAGGSQTLRCTKIQSVYVDTKLGVSPYLGDYLQARLLLSGPLIWVKLRDMPIALTQQWDNNIRLPEFNISMKVYEFSPDYDYESEGPNHIPRDAEVALLPIMIQSGGRFLTYTLALRLMSDASYQRIGLVALVCTNQHLVNLHRTNQYFDNFKASEIWIS